MGRIKKFLKKTAIFCLGFIIFTQIIDLIGWLTDEESADHSKLVKTHAIDPSKNGYEVIKFMDEPGFRFLSKGVTNDSLKKTIH